jgi:NAD(P)-dependent dehydrogenase (short-subunit alcohol dehydrogenase family)
MQLQGKVAIVTGGGRGIGRAIARRFAAEGAAVLVTARTESEVREVSAEIQKAGGKAAAAAGDVSQEADCEKMVRAAREAFGAIHILVNNAGIYSPVRPAEKVEPHEWDRVIAVNLRGPFLLSRLVLPEMYERGSGNILNTITLAAKAPFQLNSAYAASKAGLAGLTRTLAAEGARKGVRVNGISPGPVPETRMSKELGSHFAEYFHTSPEDSVKRMIEGSLQGRANTADEMAAAALFLVSDQSGAITGQILNVDGGMAFY